MGRPKEYEDDEERIWFKASISIDKEDEEDWKTFKTYCLTLNKEEFLKGIHISQRTTMGKLLLKLVKKFNIEIVTPYFNRIIGDEK